MNFSISIYQKLASIREWNLGERYGIQRDTFEFQLPPAIKFEVELVSLNVYMSSSPNTFVLSCNFFSLLFLLSLSLFFFWGGV